MPTESSTRKSRPMKVLFWGTYDLGKPRTRIMTAAVRNLGADVTEIHAAVWDGAEDKSSLQKVKLASKALRWLFAYPKLVWGFLRTPRPDVVVLGYLGHLDVLVLFPMAKIRGVPIVWDAFLSLYDTVVDDRKMVSPKHPVAFLLKSWEWLACRAADRIVLDTEAQASMFREKYNLQHSKVTAVPLGAEAERFPVARSVKKETPYTVLFYGQFIPLHGIDTIVEAARLAHDRPIKWILIGTGQKAKDIRNMLSTAPVAKLEWKDWVPYAELIEYISAADVCLGVFGESEKAGRVVPNKVFQILSAGRPLVTRDGPGIREVVPTEARGIKLVPAGDPVALLSAVEQLLVEVPNASGLHADIRSQFSMETLTKRWGEVLEEVVAQ